MAYELDREDVQDAISKAVRKQLGFSADEFLNSVRDGVYQAVTDAIRNATDMPSADFFESVKQGVKEAMLELKRPGC